MAVKSKTPTVTYDSVLQDDPVAAQKLEGARRDRAEAKLGKEAAEILEAAANEVIREVLPLFGVEAITWPDRGVKIAVVAGSPPGEKVDPRKFEDALVEAGVSAAVIGRCRQKAMVPTKGRAGSVRYTEDVGNG